MAEISTPTWVDRVRFSRSTTCLALGRDPLTPELLIYLPSGPERESANTSMLSSFQTGPSTKPRIFKENTVEGLIKVLWFGLSI